MKKRIIIIIGIALIILITIMIIFNTNNNDDNRNTINYNECKNMIDNKETFLIYFYNSKSNNNYNMEIKNYLNTMSIKYYNYNEVHIDEEEYNKFLTLLDIDADLFGLPALIYIKNGVMHGNIININSNEVVDTFIDDYDLYNLE